MLSPDGGLIVEMLVRNMPVRACRSDASAFRNDSDVAAIARNKISLASYHDEIGVFSCTAQEMYDPANATLRPFRHPGRYPL
ncbi:MULTISPECIES: hypothetical protein [Sphingomonas]|uniref:hypothetical protein n=1 Tax=Sphingomonas TaxID=13687 RepID=UPI002550047D|nr:hypothetical protein [Sphingomonas zeae]MDK8188083.1 hypothetical protein [Sphingomonas zeae]